MEGGADPDNRRCMQWEPERWNTNLLDLYKCLIRLRRTSEALQKGSFQMLYAGGYTLAFQREVPDETLLIVARRNEDGLTELPVQPGDWVDGTELYEVFSGQEAVIQNGYLPLNTLGTTDIQIWRKATT
jgi:glycosidase